MGSSRLHLHSSILPSLRATDPSTVPRHPFPTSSPSRCPQSFSGMSSCLICIRRCRLSIAVSVRLPGQGTK